MARITVNGITVDPMVQGPALAAANLEAADASGSNYILIQTREPLNKDQNAELAATGVVILEYVPDDTYICYFEPSNLNEIRTLPYVAWANVYMGGVKVAPSLLPVPPSTPGAINLMEEA